MDPSDNSNYRSSAASWGFNEKGTDHLERYKTSRLSAFYVAIFGMWLFVWKCGMTIFSERPCCYYGDYKMAVANMESAPAEKCAFGGFFPVKRLKSKFSNSGKFHTWHFLRCVVRRLGAAVFSIIGRE